MFLGGYVIKRFNMRVKEILKLIISTNVIVLFLCLSFVMRCPTGSLAGFSQDRASSEQLRQPCNSNCNCSFHNYAPVCGEDKFSYFNPCAAGCQQVIDVPVKVNTLHYQVLVLQEHILVGSCFQRFTQCTCVIEKTSGSKWRATEGKCDVDCVYLYVFIPFIALAIFGVFFTDVPALSATLR